MKTPVAGLSAFSTPVTSGREGFGGSTCIRCGLRGRPRRTRKENRATSSESVPLP